MFSSHPIHMFVLILPNCNFFLWLLAQKKCLTWENLRKSGFQGPFLCFLCSHNEECISHFFFLCPFSKEIWHRWWEAWNHGCIHAISLIDFWGSLGRPPAKSPFLQTDWIVGPIFILLEPLVGEESKDFL